MAEKKKNKEDAPEQTENKKKKLIIIGSAALVLLLVIAAVLYFFVFKTQPVPEEEKDPGLKVPVPEISQNSDIGPMVDIKEFIVNIISEDESHYVKAALTIELNKEEALEEVNKRMPQIRDAILLLVGNKTYEELHDLQGKKQLKAELVSKINSFLQNGKIKAIYFTDFVVQ
ncbi:MAG: flagellar basal body-associated FliL family protein [Proteobacteria bacterium]|nr:flagellar basal body-associated FliL family protein [Pseudomonadota bacterium]MBU1059935.1 flagellar basal body-associated FliL family protein [Pseudomonadota bacterium]